MGVKERYEHIHNDHRIKKKGGCIKRKWAFINAILAAPVAVIVLKKTLDWEDVMDVVAIQEDWMI